MRAADLYASLLANDAFRRLRSDARFSLWTAVGIAVSGAGMMTGADIARCTDLPPKRQEAALDKLIDGGLLTRVGDGYSVTDFITRLGRENARSRGRVRTQRWRSVTRKTSPRNAVPVTPVTPSPSPGDAKNVTTVTEKTSQVTPSPSPGDAETVTSDEKSVTRDAETVTDPAPAPKDLAKDLALANDDPSVRTSYSPSDRRQSVTEKALHRNGKSVTHDTSWVEPMRAAVRGILDVAFPNFTLEQRLLLGQYGAWRWANCTKDLATNRRKARAFASQLESIGAKKRFEAMTAREFIGAGNRFFKASGEIPIHNFWQILAAIERETAAPKT